MKIRRCARCCGSASLRSCRRCVTSSIVAVIGCSQVEWLRPLPGRVGGNGWRMTEIMPWRDTMAAAWTFDPVVVGRRECDAWVAYYRHEWSALLIASVGLVRDAFGMNAARTLAGAWFVLRANQAWAPYPDNSL